METMDHMENKIKNNNQPFFSVIITTYNRGQLLKKALDSLIAQTEDDWEAIIIDDESEDDTYFQVLPYLTSNHRIRYLRKKHSGGAMSKNDGISLAKGKFITFLDSDDEYKPKHLEWRKAILMKDESIRFLYGGVTIIGNQFVPDRFDPEKTIHLNNCIIGGTFFIERESMSLLNGFRKILLGEDADLYDRAVKSGVVIKETKLPTYIYHREREDSVTNSVYLAQQRLTG